MACIPAVRRSSAGSIGIAILAILLASLAPTRAAASTCIEGTNDRLVVELLFGRNIGGRLGVSEKDFRGFLDREVTTRFPDGFTLLDTSGQFRGPGASVIVREPGKYLMIALADESRDLPRVRELIEAYQSRFRQESVGLIARRACVGF